MSDNLTLIGALVATQNITVDDAILLADYCDYAEEAGLKPPTIMSAIDLALDFLRPSPDEDAATVAEGVAAAHDGHDAGTCPDCGGEMMDEVDMEQAIDVWVAIRMICDKYAFDQAYDGGRGGMLSVEFGPKTIAQFPTKCGICKKKKTELPNGFRVCEKCDLSGEHGEWW